MLGQKQQNIKKINNFVSALNSKHPEIFKNEILNMKFQEMRDQISSALLLSAYLERNLFLVGTFLYV